MLKTRTKEKQSDHDKCVESLAIDWKNDGWLVKADLEDWDKPSKIGDFIPDIEAKKRILTRICEIETDDTFEDHTKQWETFKKYCNASETDYFRLYIAKEDRKCIRKM